MATRLDGMPIKLSKVDELTLGNHPYLRAGDECFYWGEYRVGAGYKGGPTNSLISNIKKSPTLRGSANPNQQAQYRYKLNAIRTAGQSLAGPFKASGGPFTVVPVPPSRILGDPE